MTIARWGQADIPDEIVVGEGCTIQNDFSETAAKAKGKSVEDHITHWFRDEERDPNRPCEMHVRQLMLMCACNVQHTLRITEQPHVTIPGHAYDGLVNTGQLSMSQGWMQGR